MLKNQKINPLVILFLISLFGFCLRIYKLSDNPPSLNWDEISHGYNAYAILKTGADEWGVKFPIIFKAYGDYKLPVYIYLTSLSELFFGLNGFAVRLPSVIAGTITIIISFFLSKELLRGVFKNATSLVFVGLLSSLLVAVEPWSLFLSRPAFEANLALAFFVTGYYLLLKSSEKYKYLPLSLLLLGLSVWTYNSNRIFTPLMLISILIMYRQKFINVMQNNKTIAFASTLIVTVLFVPMLIQLLQSSGTARFSKVSIIDEGAIGKIVAARQNFNFNPNIERLIINKYSYVSMQFAKNWVSTYSPKFLFIEGGDNYQFSIPKTGLLYLIDLPFLLLGLLFILKNFKKSRLILLWIFLAPIAGSLTREAPHVLRTITLLPVPMILTSVGLVIFIEWSHNTLGEKMSISWLAGWWISTKKALYFAFLILLIISASKYMTKYFNEYRQNYSWSWQYGYREATDYIQGNYHNYDKIIFTKKYGEPHEFLLFYLKWDPAKYINDPGLVRYNQSEWNWVDSFYKFIFVNEWDIPTEEWQPFVTEKGALTDCTTQKCLLFSDSDSVPKTWNKLKEIVYLDGTTAFTIYSNI
ncbi:MAG: hypothetical protein US62_C0005G0010 [Candidatus Woesebacteria bacterium GW2011_GWA1_37_8]|uniref:Glycosyltransferase RgtA/B/C/D-like domain-containing protein n=2 Tax=Candidatus Woeseibacteriota TaxID=1752722 RepID=A0A0G0NLD0_9BACT|nr:MAG: hypothetical protein US39_C0004G0015 [Microgenomates group bacterium GW2011_GWC1_37_12b]KKQ46087.1 MAG: hypothetical protein US62_C0005G0010 [Candidatus Woesebacteria bacterium GW2011_GWA1_37_8]KKQ86694.1 MAG: hypothetical protein UT10_C0018G0006 [Candidatus Woesebacteria bacterium GW2011_GWB1_38_8b]